jgi:hypothetical protein
MKYMWCWRCNAEVPMLDEEESRQIGLGRDSFVEHFGRPGIEPAELKLGWVRHIIEGYERITGVPETDLSKINDHRLSLYGPPCSNCGKPLRSPKTKFCAACGQSAGGTSPSSV